MNNRPAKKKRTRNPQKTREKLLQAAVDLVAEKGPEALSLKEVAIRADVSRSVTYLHFDDRDHLLEEAKTWISDRLREGVDRFDESAPLYERILHTTRVVMKNPEVSRALMVDALTKGELGSRHPLFKLVKKRLRDLQKSGVLGPDVDVEIWAYIHLGSIAATLLYEKQHEGDNIDRLAERFAIQWSRILGKSLPVDE